jgi:small subunit ribosomal protein S29e
MPSLFNTHPKAYGQGAFWHVCRKCGNNHGLVRKYHMMLCRRCFRENAVAIGFRKFR